MVMLMVTKHAEQIMKYNNAVALLNKIYNYIDLTVSCNNCSTPDHPVFMNQVDGVYFECPICNNSILVLANIKSNISGHYSELCNKCRELKNKYGLIFGKQSEEMQRNDYESVLGKQSEEVQDES